jgi:hypothetical protein
MLVEVMNYTNTSLQPTIYRKPSILVQCKLAWNKQILSKCPVRVYVLCKTNPLATLVLEFFVSTAFPLQFGFVLGGQMMRFLYLELRASGCFEVPWFMRFRPKGLFRLFIDFS